MPTDITPDIETLRKRHKDLDRQRTTEQANLGHAQSNLDDLKAQALREYETDDHDTLRKKLEEMEAENDRQRTAYHAHLQEIQQKLEDVKKQFTTEV